MTLQAMQPTSSADITNLPDSNSSPGKIQIAGYQGCGWTRKFADEVQNGPSYIRDAFEYVECTSHSTSPVCQGVHGFPTMKYDGQVCHTGYGKPHDDLCKCMPTHESCKPEATPTCELLDAASKSLNC